MFDYNNSIHIFEIFYKRQLRTIIAKNYIDSYKFHLESTVVNYFNSRVA